MYNTHPEFHSRGEVTGGWCNTTRPQCAGHLYPQTGLCTQIERLGSF